MGCDFKKGAIHCLRLHVTLRSALDDLRLAVMPATVTLTVKSRLDSISDSELPLPMGRPVGTKDSAAGSAATTRSTSESDPDSESEPVSPTPSPSRSQATSVSCAPASTLSPSPTRAQSHWQAGSLTRRNSDSESARDSDSEDPGPPTLVLRLASPTPSRSGSPIQPELEGPTGRRALAATVAQAELENALSAFVGVRASTVTASFASALLPQASSCLLSSHSE